MWPKSVGSANLKGCSRHRENMYDKRNEYQGMGIYENYAA